MTIYVSSDHYMIATERGELHKFARTLNIEGYRILPDKCRLFAVEAERAIKLGATPVTQAQLSAMHALQLMGYDAGDPATAGERRSALARSYMGPGE